MAKTVFTPLQETDDLNVVSTWLEQNRAARDKFGSLSRVTYARDETDQQIIENARRMVAEYDRIAGLVNSSRPAQQPQAQPQAQPGFGQAATGLILGNRRMNQEQRRLEAYGDTESKIVNENYQELQEARRRLAQVPDDRPFEQSKIRQEITTLEESLSPRSLRTSAARQVASDLVGQERTRFAEDHLRRLEERRSSLDPKDPNYDSDYATATSQIRNMNEYYRFTQDGLTDSERGLIRAGEEVASWGIVPRSLVTAVSGFVDMIASPFNLVSMAAGGRPSSQRFISEGLTSPERRSFSETTGEWTADKRSWLSNQMAQTMYSLPMTVLTMANAPIGVGLTYTNMVDMNLTDMVRKYGTINDVPVASLAGSITAGLISGGVESLSNVVQVGLVNKLFKTTGFTGAKNYLKNVLTNKGMLLQLGRSVGTGALVEGAEEWVDSFAGNLVYNMVGEQNKSLSEMVAESNQAFISGAFGGALFGIFGGATQAFTQRGYWAETKKLAQIKTPGTNITSTQAKLVMDITAEMQKDSPNIDSVREMTSALYNQLDSIKNKSVKAAAANILDVTYANGIANTIFEEMQRQYPDSDILQGLDTATLSKDIYSLYQRANELIPKDTKATGIKAGLVNTIRAALQEASFGRTDKAKVLIARLNKLAKLKNVSSDPFFGKYSGILEDLTAIVGKMDSAVVEYANLSQTQAPVQRPAELDVTLIERAKELQQKKSASVEELQALSSELGEAINSTEAGKESNAYAAWKRVVDDRINKKLERSRKVEEPEAPVVVTPAPVVTKPVEPVKPVKPVTPVNAGQKASILKLKAEKAVTDADYKAMISARTEGRTESVNDLTMGEAASIIDRLQELPLRKKKSEQERPDTSRGSGRMDRIIAPKTRIPSGFRELSGEEQGGAFTSQLKKGDVFTIGDKEYTVVLDGKKFIRIKSNSGKTYTINKYFTKDGKVGSYAGGESKTDQVENLFRDIEGQITLDLLNENNPFHEISFVTKTAIAGYEKQAAEQKSEKKAEEKPDTKPRVDNKAAEERLAAIKAKNEAKNKELRANALAAIKDLSVETFAKAKVAIMKGLDVLTPSEMEQAAKKLDELRPLLDTGYSNDAMIVSEILNKAAEEQRYEESKAVEGTEDVPAKSEEEQANEFLRKSGIDPIPDTPTEPKSVTQIEAELSAIDKKIDKLEAAIAAREDKGLDATDKQQRDLDALEQQRDDLEEALLERNPDAKITTVDRTPSLSWEDRVKQMSMEGLKAWIYRLRDKSDPDSTKKLKDIKAERSKRDAEAQRREIDNAIADGYDTLDVTGAGLQGHWYLTKKGKKNDTPMVWVSRENLKYAENALANKPEAPKPEAVVEEKVFIINPFTTTSIQTEEEKRASAEKHYEKLVKAKQDGYTRVRLGENKENYTDSIDNMIADAKKEAMRYAPKPEAPKPEAKAKPKAVGIITVKKAGKGHTPIHGEDFQYSTNRKWDDSKRIILKDGYIINGSMGVADDSNINYNLQTTEQNRNDIASIDRIIDRKSKSPVTSIKYAMAVSSDYKYAVEAKSKNGEVLYFNPARISLMMTTQNYDGIYLTKESKENKQSPSMLFVKDGKPIAFILPLRSTPETVDAAIKYAEPVVEKMFKNQGTGYSAGQYGHPDKQFFEWDSALSRLDHRVENYLKYSGLIERLSIQESGKKSPTYIWVLTDKGIAYRDKVQAEVMEAFKEEQRLEDIPPQPSRQKLSDTLSKSLSSDQVDATMKLYDAMFQGYADELGITLDEAYEYLSDVVTTMPEGEAMQPSVEKVTDTQAVKIGEEKILPAVQNLFNRWESKADAYESAFIEEGEIDGVKYLAIAPQKNKQEFIRVDAKYRKFANKESFTVTTVKGSMAGQVAGVDSPAVYVISSGGVIRLLQKGSYTTQGGNNAPLYQSIRGFVQFKDGKATLGIVDPDFSTAVHEQAHIGRRLISALALRDKTGKWKSLLEKAAAWAGAKDGNWDTAADEKFAQGYEKYLLEGKAPNPQVATLFGKIKEWMSAIVGKAKELAGIKLDDNIVSVYDAMLGMTREHKSNLNKEQKAESIKLKNNMKLKNDTSSESLEKQLDSLMDKFGNLVYSRSSAKKSIITNVDLGKSIIEIIEDNGFVVNGKAFPTVYDAMQEITRLLSINTSTNSVTLKQIKRFNKSDDILFQRNIEKARDIKKQDQKKIASAYARVSNAVTRGISYTEWRNALIDLVDSLMVKHYGAYRVDYTTLMQIEDISLLNAALAKDQKYKTMMQDLTGYQDIAEVPTAQLFDIVSNLEPEYYESFMNNEYLKNLLDSTDRISKALGKNSEPIMADIFRLTLELRNEDTAYGQISKGAYRPVEVIVSALGKGGVNLVTEGYKGKIRSARMQNRAHDTLKDFDKVLFSNKNNLGRRYTADERGTISSMIFYIGSNEAIKDHRAAFAEEVERVNKQGKEQIDLKDVLHIYDSLRSLMTFFEAEGMELNKRTGKQIFYSRPNYIFRVFQTVAMAMEEKLQDSEVRLAEAPNLMRRELKIPQMGKLNVDLMAATRSYVNRTSRYIAYYELKDYYYNQMSKDIPSNLRARADSLRDWVVKYVNNTIGIYEPKSKNDQNISNARLNLYASVLVSNIVLTLQNFNQRYLAKVYAAPGVWKQVKRDLHRITGSPKARIKSPKLIELIEELHASGENQLNQFYRESEEGKLKNNNLYARVTLATSGRVLQGSPFSRFERGNWSHGHLTGAYNAIMASRQYQNAIKDGKTHYQAVEIALGNQKVRDAALISAGEINAAVNADPSMVFSPAMYQDQVGKWLFFTKFFINYANMMKNTVAFKDIGSKWSRELFNYQLSGAEDQKVIADRIMSLNQMLQDLQPSRIKTLINQYGSRLTESQLEPADFAKAYVEIKKLRDEQVKYQRDHNTFFATGRGLQRRMIAGMASYMFGDFLIQMLIQLLKRLFYEDDPLGIYNKKMKKKLIAKTEINEVGMLLAVTQVSRLGQGIGIMSGLIPKPDFRTTKGFAKSMTSYILNLTPVLGLIDTAASQTYGAKPSHLILDSLFDDK